MQATAVITTINSPTKAVKEFAKRLPVIVIGDEKTPDDKWGVGWDETSYGLYLSYKQENNAFSYQAPVNHYARKNLGYLLAMVSKADCIYDTDDDNIPKDNWQVRDRECRAMSLHYGGWVNVYSSFSKYTIWPRGLPLTEIGSKARLTDPIEIISPIQQGLADGEPDVDAIWRLTRGGDFKFEYDRSIHLPKGTWSPFNSQCTWWFKEAFPLMYLPQYCSMRMTDIIRSFVAQRCLWEMGYGVVFHSPSEVLQERNEHDLMKDFEDEVQGYLMNDKIKIALDGLKLHGGLLDNLWSCYIQLLNVEILPKEEIDSLYKWIKDIENIWKT